MQKVQEIIGLPVIELTSGKVLGQIRDLLFDDQWHFVGILLEYKGLLRDGRYIPAPSIQSVGEDCVIVRKNQVRPLKEQNQSVTFCAGSSHLKGKPVMSAEGYQLGQLEDVYLHPQMGKIVGYELSDGFWADVTEGRKIVQTSEPIILGKDALICTGPVSCNRDQTAE